MKTRRWGAAAAAGAALVALGTGPAVAEEPVVEIVPAPPGQADAVAVQVGPISIGHTKAVADPSPDGSGSEATANAVEIGGEARAEQFGGTQKGKGKKSGAFLDSGDTPLGRLAVTPWEGSVDGDATAGSPRRSDSKAALARLVLVNSGVLTVNVAQSESHATHDGKDSAANASSDGATLSLADQLSLVILHSEASSTGTGHAYLVGINDNHIGTDEDAGGQCAFEVPELLTFSCLNVSGGPGMVNAVVASAGLTPVGQGVTAVSSRGQGASGSVTAVAAAPSPSRAAELPASSDEPLSLPRTGGPLGLLALAGVVSTAIGSALLAVRRRLG